MPHVTIVEDEADIAGLLAHCFACEGFQVTTARDGDAGLEIIHRHRPDLVLMNPCLSQLSGWEVCRRIRAFPGGSQIKVVLLTMQGAAAHRVGADGYLVKGGQVEPTLPPVRVFRHPVQGILSEFLQRRAIAA